MAETFNFELVSPEQLLLDQKVAQVVVPGEEGDFGVLPGHSLVMSLIRPGMLEVYEEENSEPRRIFLKGGFAEVRPDRLVVLAEEIIEPDQVDLAELDRKIQNLREDLEDSDDEHERGRLAEEIAALQTLHELIA